MRIHIITIHHIHNFGSVLQAYCLQRYLAELGHDVDIIDYRPKYYNLGKNKIKSLIGIILNLKSYINRKRKFEDFIKQYDRLTIKRYNNIEQLYSEYKSSSDVFVAGGDQLWNSFHPCGNDDAYKLLFTDSSHKFAIGTSLGRNNQSESELSGLAEKIKDFNAIFLREESTVNRFIKYINIPCHHIIDPVGLIDLYDLKRIAILPKFTSPYAVMYLADSGELLDNCITLLANDYKLKIVHICGFKKKCYCDLLEKDIGPREILGYIFNSEFVLSASFHATFFSIIFNKQFATLLPNSQTNERIESLLKYFGLQNRIIRSIEDLKCLNKSIDFTSVNIKLNDFAIKSKQLINKYLE